MCGHFERVKLVSIIVPFLAIAEELIEADKITLLRNFDGALLYMQAESIGELFKNNSLFAYCSVFTIGFCSIQ